MPTVTVEYREFPSNNLLYVYPIPVSSGASFAWPAPAGLSDTNPTPPPDLLNWAFLFWNAGGTIDQSQTIVIGPVNTNVKTTAWYRPIGGGGGGPAVVCWAYSETQNLFLPDTPIASISGGNWSGGNDKSVETDTSATTITAKSSIGSEDFTQWMVFGNATPSGADLSAAHGASALAFARYKKATSAPLPFHWKDFLDILLARRVDPRDLVSDPSPIDIFRLGQVLEQLEQRSGAGNIGSGNIDPGAIAARIDTMSRSELKAALLELQAEEKRVEMAQEQIARALKHSKG